MSLPKHILRIEQAAAKLSPEAARANVHARPRRLAYLKGDRPMAVGIHSDEWTPEELRAIADDMEQNPLSP